MPRVPVVSMCNKNIVESGIHKKKNTCTYRITLPGQLTHQSSLNFVAVTSVFNKKKKHYLPVLKTSNLWLGQKKYVAPASGKVYQLLAHGRWFSSVVLPQLKLVAMI
jgi:hypothetical protein